MIAVNVAQLLKAVPGTTREFEFSDLLTELRDEFETVEPVQGRAHLLRTSRGIFASTTYQTEVRQACGRCLTPVVAEISGSTDDEFMPRVDVITGHQLEEQPESAELAITERHLLDLTEVIRQDILTRLPLRPLCEASCPGLCPECGRELRRGPCACGSPVESSSPFAALAELLRRQGTGEGPER